MTSHEINTQVEKGLVGFGLRYKHVYDIPLKISSKMQVCLNFFFFFVVLVCFVACTTATKFEETVCKNMMCMFTHISDRGHFAGHGTQNQQGSSPTSQTNTHCVLLSSFLIYWVIDENLENTHILIMLIHICIT
jgi:hypothetical protein